MFIFTCTKNTGLLHCVRLGFPDGSVVKKLPANTGDTGDRGAWWATVHGVTKSQTRLQQPSMHTFLKKAEKATQSKTTIIFAHQTGTLKI